MSTPAFVFKVAGSTYDHRVNRLQFLECSLYRRDGFGTFRWTVPGAPLPGTSDPFEGKAIELWIDAGLGNGSVRRFAGTCEDAEWSYTEHGWGLVYTAYDRRWRGDTVPHTDAIAGTDSSAFNLAPDDPDGVFLGARLGRTNGQIFQAVLDMPANNAALTALGIGGYTSLGYAAGATATIAAGAVSGFAITAAGSGYAAGDTVYWYGGGGSGGYGHVSGIDGSGGVTAIAIDRAGSGFTTAPTVIISALPLATVRDLANMQTLIPFPVTVQGEKLLEAIEGQLRSVAPNHMMWVRPDGVIRFLDQRSFGGPAALFSGGAGSGASATLTVNSSGVITGYTGLTGGTGYTSAPLVTVVDPSGTGAIVTATVSGGAVTGLTVSSGGSGYARALTLTLDQLDASLRAVDVSTLTCRRSLASCFSRVVGRGQPRTEAVWVGIAPAPGVGTGNNGLIEYFDHDGFNNAGAKAGWNYSHFGVSDGSNGQAIVNANVDNTGKVTSLTIQYGGYGYLAAPTLHIAGVGGFGSGASATLTISGGIVTGYTGLAQGSGYSSGATCTVDMPGGPGGDVGTCTCPSTSTVTVTSSDPLKAWGANYWDQSTSGRKGRLFLVYRAGTGLTARVECGVISNTALTPGGTSTLTVDTVLPHTSFNSYKITGQVGGASGVWRRYKITDPATAQHMAPRFSIPQGVSNADGTALSMVSAPFCRGLYSSSGTAPYQEIPIPADFDPTSGIITTWLPTVKYFGTMANLLKGGASTDGILSDFQAFLAIYKGDLTTPYPPDSGGSPAYGGTSYTARSLQRTLTVTIPTWRDPGQVAQVNAFIADIFDTVKDVQYDLSLEVIGLYEEAWTAGQALNVTGPSYSTGLDALRLPIVECSLRFPADGSKYRTVLKCSNRRAHFTAEAFVRQAPTGFTWTAGGEESFVAGSLDGPGAQGGEGLLGMAGGLMDAFGGMAGGMAGGFGDASGGALGAFGDVLGE